MAPNTPPRSKPQPAAPSAIYIPTSPESIALTVAEERRYADERQLRRHDPPTRPYTR
jgi:hypothetical protein